MPIESEYHAREIDVAADFFLTIFLPEEHPLQSAIDKSWRES